MKDAGCYSVGWCCVCSRELERKQSDAETSRGHENVGPGVSCDFIHSVNTYYFYYAAFLKESVSGVKQNVQPRCLNNSLLAEGSFPQIPPFRPLSDSGPTDPSNAPPVQMRDLLSGRADDGETGPTHWEPPPKKRWVLCQFSSSVVSDSLQPHRLQHTRPPCPSPTPGVHSDSCPWWSMMVSDAIQPSHPLSSPSPPAFSLSQHQGLFQWALCEEIFTQIWCRRILRRGEGAAESSTASRDGCGHAAASVPPDWLYWCFGPSPWHS